MNLNWLFNLWNRIKGRRQIANPLSRLVERPDAPDVYIKCDQDSYRTMTGSCK